ncbi:MAG: orotate phosphoribosyltransferase [Candidatus Omnitrophota bacterium]|nr:orotate phosphoribosyltransferase [Candidatus Omnitrophota bacterium]
MRPSEVMRLFQGCGAWMEGHFVLSSGLHSREYLQCAMILQHPTLSARACQALSQRFLTDEVTCVAGPALGGILVAYETARQLGVRSVFAERQEGKLQIRRGFQVGRKDRVLVVEDVVTTGGSVEELINLIREVGAEVVGVGALVDRSSGWVSFEVKYHALLSLDLKTFPAEACPLCKEGVPVTRPGSRTLVP